MLRRLFGSSGSNSPPPSPPGEKAVKMMMITGKCQFRGQTGRFKCTCQAGSSFQSTSAVDLDVLCRECNHPMAEHGGYATESSNPPGNHPEHAIHGTVCPRFETVESLSQLLDEHGVVHVRGTPATGKTTLAILLSHRLQNRCRVVLINSWKTGVSATQFLVENCHNHGHTHVQETNFFSEQNDDLVFIVDEAQVTYADSQLWYSVIKYRLGFISGPRFCLFSSYGSPSRGSSDYPSAITPPILSPRQRVTLTISQYPEAPQACLFYNSTEFEDVVRRFLLSAEFTLAEGLKEYNFSLTTGHPGTVGAILRFIRLYHRNHLKYSNTREIGLEHVYDLLEANDKLFKFLEYDVVGRSLPSNTTLNVISPGLVDVLLHVLRDGCVNFDPDNKAMILCYRMGFVHTDELFDGSMTCVLPSFLHARFVEYYFGRDVTRPFPFSQYPNVETLGFRILQRFSRNMLCMTRDSRRLGPSGIPRPPEACYQDEFYRCLFNEVGSGIGISSEWSGSGPGRIDFYVIGPGWGYELLREGDRLKEHCNRFLPNGAYYRSIQQGGITDWLIIDCRHSQPRATSPGNRKLWRVVFAHDYSRVQILDCDNKPAFPEFQLPNQ